jgi:hypothetical protein
MYVCPAAPAIAWFITRAATDMLWLDRKFGKQIQRRQLDLPEYAASFVNYKALKKVGLTYRLPTREYEHS